jgi:hypothetical protein
LQVDEDGAGLQRLIIVPIGKACLLMIQGGKAAVFSYVSGNVCVNKQLPFCLTYTSYLLILKAGSLRLPMSLKMHDCR